MDALELLAPSAVTESCSMQEFCRRRGREPWIGQATVPPEPEPTGVVPALGADVDLGDLDDGEPPLFEL